VVGGAQQRRDRTADLPGEEARYPSADEQSEQRNERLHQNIEAAHGLLLGIQFGDAAQIHRDLRLGGGYVHRKSCSERNEGGFGRAFPDSSLRNPYACGGPAGQRGVAALVENLAPGHSRNLAGSQALLPGEGVEGARGSYLRATRQNGGFEIELFADLPLESAVNGLIVQLELLARIEKPFFDLAVQDSVAEEHQKTDRHEAQRQRAEVELRLDAGTF